MASDHDIPLLDFVHAVRAEVERYVHHPHGREVIHEWMTEMHRAGDIGDAAAVARLTKQVRSQIRLERLFCLESWLRSAELRERHRRLRCWVHNEIENELPDPLVAWRAQHG
jgi:hypothetical protein